MPKIIKSKHFIKAVEGLIHKDKIPASFIQTLRKMHEAKLAKKLTVDYVRIMPSDVETIVHDVQEGGLQKYSKNKYQSPYLLTKNMKHDIRQAQLAENAEKEFAGKKVRLLIKEKMMRRKASLVESYQGKEAQEKRNAILEQDQRLLEKAKQETALKEATYANIKTSRMKTVRETRRQAFRDVLRGISSAKHTVQPTTPSEKRIAPATVRKTDLAI